MDERESDRPSDNPKESNDGSSRHKSKWGLSTAVHSVGFVAKKVVNNRLTESIWSSKKSSSSASSSSDTSFIVNEREKSHLEGKSITDESENSKYSDDLDNQCSWPRETGSNVVDQLEDSKPPDDSNVNTTGSNAIESENSKPPDDSNVGTTVFNVIDRSETTKPKLKPTDGSHVRPINQYRSPSMSGFNVDRPVNQHRWASTTANNVVDQPDNTKTSDGSHTRLVNQHLWPGTVGSTVLNKNSNHIDEPSRAPNLMRASLHNFATKPLQETSRDATNKSDKSTEYQPSSPNKSFCLASRCVNATSTRAFSLALAREVPAPRGDSLAPSIGVKPFPIVRGVSLTPVARGVNHTPVTKGVSPTPTTKRIDPSPISTVEDPSLTLTEVDSSPAPTVVGPNPTARGASPTPFTRSTSPRKSYNAKTISISTESGHSPKRAVSPTPARGVTRQVSPTLPAGSASPPRDIDTPVRPSSPRKSYNSETDSISTESGHSPNKDTGPTPTRAVGPTPHKSSGTRHFFKSSILSIFSKITDTRKDKHVDNHKEAAQNLELLYNIQVQWQFANASAEAALDRQRVTAEISLFDLWRTTLELRDSISAKKIDIGLLILQLKLYAVLHRQMPYIDEWSSIQREYESALSATTNDLQARSLSVPITGGIKEDINALKLIVFSTVQVLQATLSCIQSTISKLDKTHFVASELANIALHERALLDECEIFLASAAPLQVDRTHYVPLHERALPDECEIFLDFVTPLQIEACNLKRYITILTSE